MSAISDVARFGAQQAARAQSAEYYRADIDGLRGVAVLAVIGFHAFPDYFPGGYVGVDVFFVISGFLITSIILRQLERSTFTFSEFYARRIRRIFPALLIVLPACLLFGWAALLADEFELLGKHVAAAAGFVSNFVLWQESGYFDTEAELKPLLHLWSLGIEEQFYLIWPMLLLLLWRRRANIVLTAALLTLASFLLNIALAQEKPAANFYLPFTRFWELGLGCLLAIIRQSHPLLADRISTPHRSGSARVSLSAFVHKMMPIVGIGLIGAAVFLFDRETIFPGWAALLPTLGALCVIGVRGPPWFQRRIMASPTMVLMGVISYPLYLWHWPLLSFAIILESGPPDGATRVAAVLLSIALAWLTFTLFERRVRAERGTAVTLSVAGCLMLIGVVGIFIYAASGFRDRFEFDVSAIRADPRTNALCLDQFSDARDFNYCKSTQSTPPLAVFLGDSQAQAIYDGAAAEIGDRYSLTLLGRGGCPPLLDVPRANEKGCNDVWHRFLQYVAEVKPPVVVVIGGGAPLLQGPTAALAVHGIPFPISERAFEEGLRSLIVALQRTSRVIYVREIPRFESAPACFLRPIRLPGNHCSPTVERSEVEAAMASYNRIVDDMETEFPELRVVDSIPALCDARLCSQRLQSGEIIYRDALHLNLAGGLRFVRASELHDIVLDEAAGLGDAQAPRRNRTSR